MKPEGGSNANILLQFNLIEEDDEEEECVGGAPCKEITLHPFCQVVRSRLLPIAQWTQNEE